MKKRRSKIDEAAPSADSMFSQMTSKKKDGFQNGGEDIQRKLDIEDVGYQHGNRPKLNLKQIFLAMMDGEEEPPQSDIENEPGEEGE